MDKMTTQKIETKKDKAIRSLSAPTYQVRNNRTCFLRKVFAVNNDDLSYLARPPMGETNQTVAGQNKSAAKMSQKQVNLWFRERRYMMDKLDKAEDDVYQRLIAYEKTKLLIEKAREASPDRSSAALYARKMSRISNFRPDEVNLKQNPDVVLEASRETEENAKEETDKTIQENNKDKENNVPSLNVDLNLKGTDRIDGVQDVKVPNTARSSVRPITQAMSRQVSEAPAPPDRSKTELGIIRETEQDNNLEQFQNNDDTKKNSEQKVTQIQESPLKPLLRQTTKNKLRTSGENLVPKKSDEPKTNARKIEQRILNQPFTYWTQSHDGRLIPSEVPYKRREFPIPDERDDEARKRAFLDFEKKSKHDNMQRFASLCNDLDKLEKWNPMDDIRRYQALRRGKDKEKDGEENWKKLGMLRHWVRAFGMREQKELEGLDPDSEEALAKCKYIRKNANDTNVDDIFAKETKPTKKKKDIPIKTKEAKDSDKVPKPTPHSNSWVKPEIRYPTREVQTGQEALDSQRKFHTTN